MTMLIPDAKKNSILDAAYQSVFVSLHTGNPGTTGADEVTGGSYARQAENFGAASSGELTNASDITFTDMPAATVTYVGFWTLVSGGTFIGGASLAVPEEIIATQNALFLAGNLVMGVTP